VNVLACEDTRHTRKIFEKHGIHSPRNIISYRERNEELAGARIMGALKEGMSVAVCSDAGYPGISDAGYRIISKALEDGHEIEVLPGAGAVEPALLSSGLPTSSFTFKGFPPRKPGVRRRFLAMDKELPHTLIYYESPFRIQKFLAAALEVLGDRRAAVCVELTKQFEKTHRDMLSELVEQFTDKNVRGEITVVIAGNHPKFAADQGGGDGEDQPDSDEADEDPDSGADDEADMDQDSEDD
jgi:16S rRNA (cytidine1402-2'-O)-methyltransferase